MNKKKIIAVVGPTACGKSALGISIAQQFNGEIVSADSRQFYRGMDIGTAKVSKEELAMAPHHMIDIANPDETITLYDFQKRAYEVIDDILKRGKLPVIVGGTGMYVSSIIENYKLSEKEVDQELRAELNSLTLDQAVEKLRAFNPQTTVDVKNMRRVVRELEYHLTDPGYAPSTQEPKYDVLILEPAFDRDELYKRINKRVGEMVKNGLLGEVDSLVAKYGWQANALTAIGYREFSPLEDVSKLPDWKLNAIIELIKQDSRNYAKRQITWFRRYGNRILSISGYEQARELIASFLKP